MSAHVLSPRPADFLPPTLQPHAIADAAPATDRRLSLALSCLCYTGIVAALVFAAKHPDVLRAIPPTVRLQLIDPDEPIPQPPEQDVITAPIQPAAPSQVRSVTDEKDVFTPINVVPDEAGPLLNMDLSHRGSQSSEVSNLNTVIGTPTSNPVVNHGGGLVSASRPTILEVAPTALRVLHQVQPTYPMIAKMARVQGSVVLQMTIDASGVPTDVRVMSSPHTALEMESIRVARLWRFEPAKLEGQPIAARFTLTLNYVLR